MPATRPKFGLRSTPFTKKKKKKRKTLFCLWAVKFSQEILNDLSCGLLIVLYGETLVGIWTWGNVITGTFNGRYIVTTHQLVSAVGIPTHVARFVVTMWCFTFACPLRWGLRFAETRSDWVSSILKGWNIIRHFPYCPCEKMCAHMWWHSSLVSPTESLMSKSFRINFHDSCRDWKNTLYFSRYPRERQWWRTLKTLPSVTYRHWYSCCELILGLCIWVTMTFYYDSIIR